MLKKLGKWHRDDPATSVVAALRNYHYSGSQRQKVLTALGFATEIDGLTAEEVTQATGIPSSASGNSAAKRLSELKQEGLVETTGETRLTTMGCPAEVYVLTDAGWNALGID